MVDARVLVATRKDAQRRAPASAQPLKGPSSRGHRLSLYAATAFGHRRPLLCIQYYGDDRAALHMRLKHSTCSVASAVEELGADGARASVADVTDKEAVMNARGPDELSVHRRKLAGRRIRGPA